VKVKEIKHITNKTGKFFLLLHKILKITEMKKYLILLLIPVFFACGRAAKKEAEALKAKNDSLLTQTTSKDEAINDFIKTVNDIQGTLDTIKMKENIITVSTDKQVN